MRFLPSRAVVNRRTFRAFLLEQPAQFGGALVVIGGTVWISSALRPADFCCYPRHISDFPGWFFRCRGCCYPQHSLPGAPKIPVVIGGTIRIFVCRAWYCYSAHSFQSVEFWKALGRVVIRGTFLEKSCFFPGFRLLFTAHFQKNTLFQLLFTAQFPQKARSCPWVVTLRTVCGGREDFFCVGCYRQHSSDFLFFSCRLLFTAQFSGGRIFAAPVVTLRTIPKILFLGLLYSALFENSTKISAAPFLRKKYFFALLPTAHCNAAHDFVVIHSTAQLECCAQFYCNFRHSYTSFLNIYK